MIPRDQLISNVTEAHESDERKQSLSTVKEEAETIIASEPRDLSGIEGVEKFTVGLDEILSVIQVLVPSRGQSDLAKKLKVAQPTISNKLSGKRELKIKDVKAFMGALGYDVSFYIQKRDTSCPCAFTAKGCTCQSFDASNGGVINE